VILPLRKKGISKLVILPLGKKGLSETAPEGGKERVSNHTFCITTKLKTHVSHYVIIGDKHTYGVSYITNLKKKQNGTVDGDR
jgi:hypothetical protein